MSVNSIEMLRPDEPLFTKRDHKKLEKYYKSYRFDDFFTHILNAVARKTKRDIANFESIYFWDQHRDSEIFTMTYGLIKGKMTPQKAYLLRDLHENIIRKLEICNEADRASDKITLQKQKNRRNIPLRRKRAAQGEVGAQKIYEELLDIQQKLESNTTVNLLFENIRHDGYIRRAFDRFLTNYVMPSAIEQIRLYEKQHPKLYLL